MYVCSLIELDAGGIVTYNGRRRERDFSGERFYSPHTRSVRLRAGEWVEWADDRGVVTA